MYNSLTGTEKLSLIIISQCGCLKKREALALVSLVSPIMLNEIQSLFLRIHINVADSVPVFNSIYLVRDSHKLWTECGGYKLICP